jgi:ATP-dependent DNA helicase UvrD/PcrA
MALVALRPVGRQVDVVKARERRVLVKGGPGSGKTATALMAARRILGEPTNAGRRALFLTFSRAATSEIAARAPGILGGDIGSRIDVRTFHAFCVEVLNGFRRFAGGPEEPVTIVTREETDLELVPEGGVSFDELITETIRLLNDAPWVGALYRKMYAVVISDEYQDTTDEQDELLGVIAADSQLVCLADPEQMIYDFIHPSVARRVREFEALGPRVIELDDRSFRDPSEVIPRAAAAIRDGQYDDDWVREACSTGRMVVDQLGRATDVHDYLVEQAWTRLEPDPAATIGIFFARNAQVAAFADRLRAEGIEHEIAGLSGASGEAQVVAAISLRWMLDEVPWEAVLQRLGVFLAASTRGKPPLVAVQLASNPGALDPGLAALLGHERDQLWALREAPIGEILGFLRGVVERVFLGRSQRLWELGLDDLIGLSLVYALRPLEAPTVAIIANMAASRRARSAVDAAPAGRAPVRLMNIYQVKGREMDFTYLVHTTSDVEPRSDADADRLRRVQYVGLARARHVATVVLPVVPQAAYRQFQHLCA